MPKKTKTFKEKTVDFEVDAKGVVIATYKGKSEPATLGYIDLSELGKDDVKDGTMFATHRNPTCFWYRYNGQWYWYCC